MIFHRFIVNVVMCRIDSVMESIGCYMKPLFFKASMPLKDLRKKGTRKCKKRLTLSYCMPFLVKLKWRALFEKLRPNVTVFFFINQVVI